MRNTRTRWLYAIGAPVAVAAVVIVGTVTAHAAMAPRPTAGPAADLQFGAPAASAPTKPVRNQSTTPDSPPAKPLGDVIDSGLADKTGTWVFYGTPVADKAIPKTHFGIMAGRRLSSGELTADVMANESAGSDKAPGFHAVQGSMELDEGTSPTFGYYVGPAAEITAVVGGKSVIAKQATWSEDRSVVVFWFSPNAGSPHSLGAYGSDGHRLTTGDKGVGVG
jgi:hypothetical protein